MSVKPLSNTLKIPKSTLYNNSENLFLAKILLKKKKIYGQGRPKEMWIVKEERVKEIFHGLITFFNSFLGCEGTK